MVFRRHLGYRVPTHSQGRLEPPETCPIDWRMKTFLGSKKGVAGRVHEPPKKPERVPKKAFPAAANSRDQETRNEDG